MSLDDLTRELRAARPAAPQALRERVRELAARPPPPAPSLVERLGLRRLALVAAPAAAALALIGAGVADLSRSGTPLPAESALTAQAPPSDAAAGEARQRAEAAPAEPATAREDDTAAWLLLAGGLALALAAAGAALLLRARGR
jgi:hypothetical protein